MKTEEAYTKAIEILGYMVNDYDKLQNGELGQSEFMEGRELDVAMAREVLASLG